MSEHTPKPRKPRPWVRKGAVRGDMDADDSCLPIVVFGEWLTLAHAKRLHTWLGRVIAYIEARR